jgi:hypothetical protein
MTPVPAQTPAPQTAAASGSTHGSPARQTYGSQASPLVPGGRVRNRRERQRAARSAVHTAEPGTDPARSARTARTRRPEPFKALTLDAKVPEVPPLGARPSEARRPGPWPLSAAVPAGMFASPAVQSRSGTVESP